MTYNEALKDVDFDKIGEELTHALYSNLEHNGNSAYWKAFIKAINRMAEIGGKRIENFLIIFISTAGIIVSSCQAITNNTDEDRYRINDECEASLKFHEYNEAATFCHDKRLSHPSEVEEIIPKTCYFYQSSRDNEIHTTTFDHISGEWYDTSLQGRCDILCCTQKRLL